MDAKEYDRIADLLMQIRKKYKKMEIKDEFYKTLRDIAIGNIDGLLNYNDTFAGAEAKGWL